MTEATRQTLEVLRDPVLFKWYVIPLFALVTYVYASAIQKKQWSLVYAGLAYWGMDWFNEIWNGLVLHFTNYAPVWGVAKDSAFILLIGLNIEICFMFAIAGIAFCKMLPEDKNLKIYGVNNRVLFALIGAAFCVFVEILLNLAGALIWEWPFWNVKVPFLIFFAGYLPFFAVSFRVYDMEDRKKQARVVGGILLFDAVLLMVFGVFLKWI